MIAVADFLYRIYHQLVTTNGLETDKNASEVMKKLRQYAKDNAESEDFVQGFFKILLHQFLFCLRLYTYLPSRIPFIFSFLLSLLHPKIFYFSILSCNLVI